METFALLSFKLLFVPTFRGNSYLCTIVVIITGNTVKIVVKRSAVSYSYLLFCVCQVGFSP